MHKLQAGAEDFRLLFPISGEESAGIRFQQQMYYYKSSLAVKMQDPAVFHGLLEWSWGKWLGRESEFFKECAVLVDPLSWSDVNTIVGNQVSEMATQTTKIFDDLTSQTIPKKLTRGIIKKISLNDSTVRVWGYAAYDPIDLPKSIVDVLPYFNGATTEEIVQRIDVEKGVRLSSEILRKLIDFGILITTETQRHGAFFF